MKNKKALITVMILSIVSIGLYIASSYTSQDKEFLKNPTIQNSKGNEVEEKKILDKDIKEDTKKEEKEQEQQKENKTHKKDITFLMMGVDEGERSDTIIVFKYFGNTGKMSALSIPRDTRTEIPGYGLDKINHANAYKGPELSLQAINNLLGTDIEHYVKVDYNLVKEVVDTIGGVDIYAPKDTYYWKEGIHHLNGEDSIEFVRYRAGYVNQDLGRISSQQEFLKQVMTKMKDTQNILEITQVMKSGIDNINTNIPLNKMLSYLLTVKNFDTSNLQMTTLPGTPQMINKISYIIVDRDDIPEIVDEMFYNDEVK